MLVWQTKWGRVAVRLLFGTALLAGGCAGPPGSNATENEQSRAPAAGSAGPGVEFGRKLGHWFSYRPADPEAAAMAWGQACTDAGGSFIPDARGALETRNVGVFVPGKGWCRFVVKELDLFLVGVWPDAASLTKWENLTLAAVTHHFFIFYKSTPIPPGQPAGTAMEGAIAGVAAIAQSMRQVGNARVVRSESRPDRRNAGCALSESESVLAPPEHAALGEYRMVATARVCVGASRVAAVQVLEGAWSTDTGATARGAPVRDQIDRILASLSVDR